MKTLLIPLALVFILSACVGEDVIYPEPNFVPVETQDTTKTDTSISEPQMRTGIFDNSYSSHYTTIGTVKLIERTEGKLQIEFQEDTEIGSGPSLYLLLTNRTSTPFSVDQTGSSLTVNSTSAQITLNKLSSGFTGKRTYDVPEGVTIGDYKYVVWYCTFGPVFGYAELD